LESKSPNNIDILANAAQWFTWIHHLTSKRTRDVWTCFKYRIPYWDQDTEYGCWEDVFAEAKELGYDIIEEYKRNPKEFLFTEYEAIKTQVHAVDGSAECALWATAEQSRTPMIHDCIRHEELCTTFNIMRLGLSFYNPESDPTMAFDCCNDCSTEALIFHLYSKKFIGGKLNIKRMLQMVNSVTSRHLFVGKHGCNFPQFREEAETMSAVKKDKTKKMKKVHSNKPMLQPISKTTPSQRKSVNPNSDLITMYQYLDTLVSSNKKPILMFRFGNNGTVAFDKFNFYPNCKMIHVTQGHTNFLAKNGIVSTTDSSVVYISKKIADGSDVVNHYMFDRPTNENGLGYEEGFDKFILSTKHKHYMFQQEIDNQLITDLELVASQFDGIVVAWYNRPGTPKMSVTNCIYKNNGTKLNLQPWSDDLVSFEYLEEDVPCSPVHIEHSLVNNEFFQEPISNDKAIACSVISNYLVKYGKKEVSKSVKLIMPYFR
jgi:hypothetical protein